MKQTTKYKLIGTLVVLLTLGSCSSSIEPQEYLKWVESNDNGLFGTKQIENIEYKIHYKPHEYVALKSFLKDESLGFNETKKQLGDLQYFTFQLKTVSGNQTPLKYGLRSENEYYERIGYMSFGIQNDIKLIENGDTLNCVLAVFERNYNIAPVSTFSLAFESSSKSQTTTKEFLFVDKVFNNGPIKLKIEQENLKNIPELRI